MPIFFVGVEQLYGEGSRIDPGLNGFLLRNWQRNARCDVKRLRIVQAALRLGSIALWTVVMRLICSVNILSLSGSASVNIRLMRMRSICICSAGKVCWGMSVTIFQNPILPMDIQYSGDRGGL